MRLGGGKREGERGTANATGDAFYCHVLRNEGDTQRETDRRTAGQTGSAMAGDRTAGSVLSQ